MKQYSITSVIFALISFSVLSFVSAEESFCTATYSTPSVATTSTSTVQEVTPSPEPAETETWINVRSDRAVQVGGIGKIDRIVPDSEFFKPVEAQGGQLVGVGIKIKNTGEESGGMAWSTYQLIDSQGRKSDEINDFSESLSIKQWLKEGGIEEPGNQLFPGQTIGVLKVFRVAPDAYNLKLAVNGKLISTS